MVTGTLFGGATLFVKMSAKKPGKLNKTERERLEREEEEERKLKEEEEARLQAEREEEERLEIESIEQKEQQRLELKDQERREDELNELRHLLEDNHNAVARWKMETREKAKWDRYMRCDGSPDPTVQQEINTYISLWRDDPEINITAVLKQCALTLQLIEELEGLLADVREPGEIQRHQDTLLCLQELIHSKHLLSSEEILKWSSTNADIETGNMQTVIKDDNVTLCLWANISKNPRFTDIGFEEAGLGFELPKQLAGSDIAVRILHTRYDHLTPLARMRQQSAHTPTHRSLSGGQDVAFLETDSPEQEETGGEGEITEGGESPPTLLPSGTDEEVQSVRGADGRTVTGTDESVASIRESDGRTASGTDEEAQSVRESDGQKQSTVSQASMRSAGQKPVEEAQPGPMVTQTTDTVLGGPALLEPLIDSSVVDLLQYTPLGGVFYWDVFRLPPQSQRVDGWEIIQLLDTGHQVFPYPPTEQAQPQGSASVNAEEDSGVQLACPPVGMSVTLPDSVLFLEQPRVARWDPEGKQWKTDGINDVSYEAAEAKLSFKMDSFHAFVLMQDAYLHLPLQGWELRPLGQDSALFTVNTALIDLSITVQGNQCMLQSEQEKGLSHLAGRWMDGPALHKAMVSAGVNIFVNEYTDKYVSSCAKDPLIEHAAYEQMALLSSAYAFSWSQWNAKCGPEHLVMQVCEHHGPSPVPRGSWSVFLLGAQRCQKLKIVETEESFSPELHPDTEFHSTFVHMLREDTSVEGLERTRKSQNLFVDTVQSLVCATRTLIYA